jgi:hypothetical protein
VSEIEGLEVSRRCFREFLNWPRLKTVEILINCGNFSMSGFFRGGDSKFEEIIVH